MSVQSTTTALRSDRRHGGSTLIASACLLGCFVCCLPGCSGDRNEYIPPPPPEVTYAVPIAAPITPFVDENGTTEAANEAEVRARVRGFLKSIEFQPGQVVKQGDLLYTIEKDEYEAAFESASAKKEVADAAIGVAQASVKTAEATLLRATQDLDREEQLKTQNASSQAQYDAAVAESVAAKAALEAARANVRAAESQKLQAEADLRQARIDLDFTEVNAEIDGRITRSEFKVGNLVENGSHLATIVDDRQIYANFSISDRAALKLMSAREAAGVRESSPDREVWRGTPVYLAREGDKGYPFEGNLDDVDQSGVDVATGTLGLRAIFENEGDRLLPGLFVSLRVPAAEAVNSLLIPQQAVMRDQQGIFVLTIDDNNKVGRVPIDLGQSVGEWAIVLDGIKPTTRVVVDGIQFARPDSTVVPIEATFEVDATMLLRGMSDPESSMTAPMSENTTSPPGDIAAASNQPTQE